jgi:RNA polymerase sigma factor (TIGR02999 family)
MPLPSAEITTLLKAWQAGDEQALEQLTPLVYEHMRKLARHYVRKERPDGRHDATSLVHQAYVRLVDARTVDWRDRAHFFAVSARIMRRILVDAARARASAKRGGRLQRVEHSTAINFDRLPAAESDRAADLCALDDALNALVKKDPRRAQVIELRFFGGLSVEETAEALGVSPQTVMRDWKLARAWLAVELRTPSGGSRATLRKFNGPSRPRTNIEATRTPSDPLKISRLLGQVCGPGRSR